MRKLWFIFVDYWPLMLAGAAGFALGWKLVSSFVNVILLGQ